MKVAGVIASQPDQRDYIYVPRTLNLPPRFSRRQYVVEYEDQGDQGACVGNGVASTLETHSNHFGSVLDLSRQFIYNAGRHLEGRLGEEGMYVRSAYKVLQRYGVPPEEFYPYGLDRNSNPPQAVYDAASAMKVARYEFVYNRNAQYGNFTQQQIVDRIKAALLEGLIPTIALGVTTSIFGMKGPWRTQQYQLMGPTSTDAGGHLMYVIGWDDDAGRFEVVNSWGQGWGDWGIGGFPYAIVGEPWFESWVCRDFAGMAQPEAPGIKLEYLNGFACGARIVPETEEVGKTVNVWIGAVIPRIQNPSLTHTYLCTSLTQDHWHLQAGDSYPPAGQITLTEDNPVKLVKWMNLERFKGAVLYCAYGDSPMNWKLAKVAEVK